uniref:Dihydroorotate dehydrogenase (quinone), mitochondrial n=1 Tax=Daphnia galeata TaxID=27404 RepID=A0A8J2WK22_9CRUS|nr:unnamed protein product [Daphnia galeata]
MPFTRRLDPETSHQLAVFTMKHCLLKKLWNADPESMATSLWGMNFSNPVGMAAGFDKQAEAMQGFHRTSFGFVEIGSVTPEPQEGNPKPRVFRLEEDNAIVNRVKLEGQKQERAIIGVKLGKNKLSSMVDVADYVDGVKKFGAVADYLVINVSSPNSLLNNLSIPKLPPLLLKVAPDLNEDEEKDIVTVILKEKTVSSYVTYTTISRPSDLKSEFKDQIGGLSGQPLKDISTRCIGDFNRLTGGRIPIVGVGGVASVQDAFEKILAGASLFYTSFAFHGPPVVRRIKRELDEILRSKGYKNMAEAIGNHLWSFIAY